MKWTITAVLQLASALVVLTGAYVIYWAFAHVILNLGDLLEWVGRSCAQVGRRMWHHSQEIKAYLRSVWAKRNKRKDGSNG